MVDTKPAYSLIILTAAGDRHNLLPLDTPAKVCQLTNVWALLEQQRPQLILVTDWDDHYPAFFQAVHDVYEPLKRPAIVLCVRNDIPDPRCETLVDAVLPYSSLPLPFYVIRQIIGQKTRLAEMQQRIQAMEENARIHKSQYPPQPHTTLEIEVLKNTIVRNVSHELTTPLLQVKSAVALLAEDMQDNKLIEYATRATARLEAVVKNISQMAASLDEMHPAPLIIRECIDSALRDLRRTWEYKQHIARVQVNVEKDLPPAYADRQGITTVLQQLIDNALKFSTDTVEVSVHHQDNWIVVRVSDHGIGIDPQQMDSIFDSFYQVDSSSRRSFGGAGVGLANVRLILDRHNVNIEVQSTRGQGSTFTFRLPTAHLTEK